MVVMAEEVGWLTQSAEGTDDRTSPSLWWQGTCGSSGAWWADDGIDYDIVV